jgi:hypothetical protein
MKYLALWTLGVVLAAASDAPADDGPPGSGEERPGGGVLLAQNKQPPHRVIPGHTLVSRERLRQLRQGTHHVANLHGHRMHVVLHQGEIARVFLTHPSGRAIHPTRTHRPARRAAADFQDELPGTRQVAQDVAQLVPGGGVVFTFRIQANGVTLTFIITFPVDSVLGLDQPLPGPGIGTDLGDSLDLQDDLRFGRRFRP